MSPHAHHTDKQWKNGGRGRWEVKNPLKLRCTHNAPSSHHTDKQVLQPKACGIQHMQKYTKTTDNCPQLLLVVNSLNLY